MDRDAPDPDLPHPSGPGSIGSTPPGTEPGQSGPSPSSTSANEAGPSWLDPLSRALGLALTGEPGCTDPDLSRQVRQRCRDEERAWPMPVPLELLAEIGYGRWAAVLQQALLDLGPASAPTRRAGLPDADERRLLQDRPPHW